MIFGQEGHSAEDGKWKITVQIVLLLVVVGTKYPDSLCSLNFVLRIKLLEKSEGTMIKKIERRMMRLGHKVYLQITQFRVTYTFTENLTVKIRSLQFFGWLSEEGLSNPLRFQLACGFPSFL